MESTNSSNPGTVRRPKNSRRELRLWHAPCAEDGVACKKNVANLVRGSEIRYRTLFNAMSSGVAIYSASDDGKDFIFVDINPAGERLSHVRKEHAIGKSILDVFPGVRAMGLFDVFQQVWRTGEPKHHPASVYRDDRLFQWFENYVYKLPSGEIVAVYDEITDRKRAEETLRKSEEKYASIFNSAADGIISTDRKGNVLDTNPAFIAMTGLSKEDVLGKNAISLVKRFVRAKDVPRMLKIVKAALLGKHLGFYELEYRGKTFEISVPKPTSESSAIVGILRDITEKKKTENQIRSVAKFPEENPNPVLRVDADGRVMYANGPARQLLHISGSAVGEWLPMQWREWCVPALARYISQYIEAKHEGRAYAFNVVPIKESGYANIYIFDVTERKDTEAALQHSEEKYKILHSTSMDAMMTLEPPSWNFTSGNPASILMFGAKDEKEFISLSPWQVSPKYQPDGLPSAQKAKRMIGVAMTKGSNFFEWTHRRVDGSEFPATVLLTGVKIKGKTVVQATVRDITLQKKAEEEREKLHTQAKERLIHIQKQNIQLMRLQKKIKQYAHKLEDKVEKLEKGQINLTENEKKVLYAITAHPDINDREIALKTAIKRSTVTAIRNRLSDGKWYRLVAIPNIRLLGCGLLTVIYGNYEQNYSAVRAMAKKLVVPNMVFSMSTKRNFLVIGVFRDIVSFHKETDAVLNYAVRNRLVRGFPKFVHMPLELCELHRFFSFAQLVSGIFGEENKASCKSTMEKQEVKLNQTMKEVLYAIIKYPEASTTEIAKMLRISRAAAAMNRKRLFDAGIVSLAAIPDLKRINCEIVTLSHSTFDPQAAFDMRKENKQLCDSASQLFLCIQGNNEVVSLNAFRNFSEHIAFRESEIKFYRSNSLITGEPEVVRFDVSDIALFEINFAPIAKILLGVNVDI